MLFIRNIIERSQRRIWTAFDRIADKARRYEAIDSKFGVGEESVRKTNVIKE